MKSVSSARVENVVVAPHPDDQRKFEQLYRLTSHGVYTYLYRLCDSAELAEDLLQETFLAVYRSLSAFQARSSAKTWVYTIATNKFRDHCRKSWVKAEVDSAMIDEKPAAEPTPMEAAIRGEERLLIRQAIRNLPEELRVSLFLVRFGGLKYREAAQVLGTTLDTVRMRIHRAQRLLAAQLEKNS